MNLRAGDVAADGLLVVLGLAGFGAIAVRAALPATAWLSALCMLLTMTTLACAAGWYVETQRSEDLRRRWAASLRREEALLRANALLQEALERKASQPETTMRFHLN